MNRRLAAIALACAAAVLSGCEKAEEDEVVSLPLYSLIDDPTDDRVYETPFACVGLSGLWMRDERDEPVTVSWHNETTGDSGDFTMTPYEGLWVHIFIRFCCWVPLAPGLNHITVTLREMDRSAWDWIDVTCSP